MSNKKCFSQQDKFQFNLEYNQAVKLYSRAAEGECINAVNFKVKFKTD